MVASSTKSREDLMPTFMMSLSWTDQGIRSVKDSPKRSEAAQELAKKVGVALEKGSGEFALLTTTSFFLQHEASLFSDVRFGSRVDGALARTF
jgi:hypothetical protein